MKLSPMSYPNLLNTASANSLKNMPIPVMTFPSSTSPLCMKLSFSIKSNVSAICMKNPEVYFLPFRIFSSNQTVSADVRQVISCKENLGIIKLQIFSSLFSPSFHSKTMRYDQNCSAGLLQQIFFKCFPSIKMNFFKKHDSPNNKGRNRHIRCNKIG